MLILTIPKGSSDFDTKKCEEFLKIFHVVEIRTNAFSSKLKNFERAIRAHDIVSENTYENKTSIAPEMTIRV